MKRVLLIWILFSFFGGHSQEMGEFTLLRDHILTYGEELTRKKAKGKREVTTVILTTANREFQYLDFGNREHIRVIHLSKEPKLPRYFLAKENNSIKISAFFSRFDSEEEILRRKEDWDELVYEIEVLKIPKHLLATLELGNYYWEQREIVKAQKAYQKFVDLMKFEDSRDLIPQRVHDRLFRCRLRKL